MYNKIFKRILDLFISSTAIALLFPLLFLVTLIIYIQTLENPFFFQIRPGRHMRPFRIFKFRTMNSKKDENGLLLPDNARMTSLGRILRRLSIDELPQLFNIVIGDMSVVGPRPLLFTDITPPSEKTTLRQKVRPGLTGWAQINGRYSLSESERLLLDIHYVNNMTFLLDLKIIILTPLHLIK